MEIDMHFAFLMTVCQHDPPTNRWRVPAESCASWIVIGCEKGRVKMGGASGIVYAVWLVIMLATQTLHEDVCAIVCSRH
jgi:hypothetical protein